MALRGLLLCVMWCVGAIAQPRVRFVEPMDHDILHSGRVEIRIGVDNFRLPQDGYANIFLNGQHVSKVSDVGHSFIVMLDNGWHSMEAFLVDVSGVPVGKDAFINFEVDVIDEAEIAPLSCSTGLLPMVHGMVSVVIGSRNRFDSLQRTVDSVLNQTYRPIEVIVVDDGSTDPRYHTHPLAHVTLLHLAKNCGKPGLVRNRGIAISSGEWVAFVDDDDVWMPTKLERQVEAMRRTNVNMSSTDALVGHGPYGMAKYISEENSGHLSTEAGRPGMGEGERWKGGPDPAVDWPPYGYPRWLADLASEATVRSCVGENVLPEMWNRSLVVRNNFHVCSSVIVNRDALIRAGGFGEAMFAEDYMLWKRVMRYTDSVFVREPLTYYQLAPDGLAAAWLKEKEESEQAKAKAEL